MPHIDLWEPCCFTKVPDGPQTDTLNVLWLQDEGAHKTEETLDEHQNRISGLRYEPATFKKRSMIVTLLTKVFDQFLVNKYCTMNGVTCLVPEQACV